MRKGFFLSIVFMALASAFWMSVPTGCANIIPPSGGPRDTIPPVLIAANPKDSTLNFRGDRIMLTFDEDLDDPKEPNTIIYTPAFENPPTVTTKGRVLTVKFNDSTLHPNTTYVINFGNSIVDVTEGNAVKNLVYAFSTGPYLDSLEISGKVILAETGSVDSTMIVVLHKNLRDSAVRTKAPQYVARLDHNGNFRFRYLPKDTFAIYAIGDATMSRRYQTPTQLFAFMNTPVVAGQADSLVLYAFREAPSNTNSASAAVTPKTSTSDRRLRFTPGTMAQQELLNDFVLNFPVPLQSFDSTKMHLATDSVYKPVPFTASLDTSKKEVRLKTNWKEGTAYHLILEKDFATDTAGRQLLKADTLSFVTKKKEDYGSLSLRIKGIEKFKNPVLQFVQNNQVLLSVPIKSGVYKQDLFIPGEYSLRVFDDVNGNGKWDTGKFFGEKRQPEVAHPIQRTITIKPNWDNEFDVVL